MKATVIANEIAVTYTKADNGREYLKFSVPNGWDDVKKVCKKVLAYDGKRFTFSCWNSDDLYCIFIRNEMTAKFIK